MRKIFLLLTVLAVFISCDINFLETEPIDQLTVQSFFQNENDVKVAVNGIYNALLVLNRGREFLDYECMTDNMVNVLNKNYGAYEFALGEQSSKSIAAQDKWDKNYRGIARANLVLDKIDQAYNNETNKILKERYRGEALFLRAYFYSDLIDFFGDVPLKRKPSSIEDPYTPRYPKRIILDSILIDLDSAILKLPVRYPNEENGRATKGAALSLKGKVLLFNDRFEEAAECFKDVIELKDDTGKKRYSLYNDYRKLFLTEGETNDEAIFDVQYMKNMYPEGLTHNYNVFCINYSTFSVTLSLADEYYTTKGYPIKMNGEFIDKSLGYDSVNPLQNRDPRLEMSILRPGDPYRGTAGVFNPTSNDVTRMKCKKGTNVFSIETNIWDNNFILIRYADVLLMYAEALIRSGQWNNPEVKQSINEVRKRPTVNMPTVEVCEELWDAPLNQDKMLRIVQHERRVELAFEAGIRLSDIRRWKQSEIVMNQSVGGYVRTSKNPFSRISGIQSRHFDPLKGYLWPIPQTEIDANPQLGNNPDYPEITFQNPNY